MKTVWTANIPPHRIDLARCVREAPADALVVVVEWVTRSYQGDRRCALAALTPLGHQRGCARDMRHTGERPGDRCFGIKNDGSETPCWGSADEMRTCVDYGLSYGNPSAVHEEARAWVKELRLRESRQVQVTMTAYGAPRQETEIGFAVSVSP